MKTKFLIVFLLALSCGLQAKQIKVMLLTGQTDKYHNWQVTSSYLKATLDHQERFNTDVVLFPASGKSPDEFSPNFSAYKVVVLDLNLPEWPEKVKTAFENYVNAGGGVVVIHEANNACPHWKAYNLMTGLGGWGDRNEKSGPYYYWKDGQYITDTTPGPGGSHGKRVPFVINIRDTEHPITKGLPTKWLHQNDELYGNLRGPAENIHVIATAFSEKDSGGTGKEEPVLFTVTYGKGRIYHCVLGHTGADFSDSVQDVGFQVTFSRGTEWAATGKVKQKIPKEFPTETSVLLNDFKIAQSTSVAPAKLSNKWLYLLDNQFSNFDKFVGVPHYSITSLPEYPKGNGMEGTPIGLNKDPLNVFSMITENNAPVLKITGEIYAGLSTKEEYDNYHLSVQFKWGEKKYEPRLNNLRDNGILYHCCSEHGSFWNVWMRSIEMQIQEGEMGDLYALSKRRLLVPSKLDADSVFMYDPKGKLEAYGELEPRIKGRCKSQKHYEKPNGEWNTLELICVGDTSLHIVNGVVVNMIIEDTKTEMANNDPFKRKGKIQFQCEGAEAYYKDIKIRKATKFPKDILKQL